MQKQISKITFKVINVTRNTSVELHSHWDVFVPSPWMNPDVTSYYSWKQTILNNWILIPVSCKVLREET